MYYNNDNSSNFQIYDLKYDNDTANANHHGQLQIASTQTNPSYWCTNKQERHHLSTSNLLVLLVMHLYSNVMTFY